MTAANDHFVRNLAELETKNRNRRERQRALRTHTQEAITDGWVDLVQGYPTTHAITIAYNTVRRGQTTGSCDHYDGDGVLAATRKGAAENALYHSTSVALSQVHEDLDRLHYWIDRQLCGPKFHHLSECERSGFVGFVERADSNVHAHLAWRAPLHTIDHAATADAIRSVISRRWIATTRGRTCDVQVLYGANWPKYINKSRWQIAFGDQPDLFVSSRKIPE